MRMTLTAVVFFFALFACLVVLMTMARRKLVGQPLEAARPRNAPVAEFVDDLQRHWWVVVIGLALVVAVDKHFGVSHGALQSKLVLAAVVTVIFGARLLSRRRSQAAQSPNTSANSDLSRHQ